MKYLPCVLALCLLGVVHADPINHHLTLDHIVTPNYPPYLGFIEPPYVAIPTDDDGVVLAGRGAGWRAYAAKVNKSGEIDWTHQVDSPDKKLNHKIFSPEYKCGAVVSNGNICLGGTLPDFTKWQTSFQCGIITLIDKNGNIINEIFPSDENKLGNHGYIAAKDAVRVNDDIAILFASTSARDSGSQIAIKIFRSYFIAIVDGRTGEIKHRISLPVPRDDVNSMFDQITYIQGGDFVISSRTSVGASIVIRIDMLGNIKAMKSFRDGNEIVHFQETQPSLWLCFYGNHVNEKGEMINSPVVASYDEALNETSRIQASNWSDVGYRVTRVYGLSRGRFVFTCSHTSSPKPFIAYMKADDPIVETIDLTQIWNENINPHYFNEYAPFIWAASPIANKNAFIASTYKFPNEIYYLSLK